MFTCNHYFDYYYYAEIVLYFHYHVNLESSVIYLHMFYVLNLFYSNKIFIINKLGVQIVSRTSFKHII